MKRILSFLLMLVLPLFLIGQADQTQQPQEEQRAPQTQAFMPLIEVTQGNEVKDIKQWPIAIMDTSFLNVAGPVRARVKVTYTEKLSFGRQVIKVAVFYTSNYYDRGNALMNELIDHLRVDPKEYSYKARRSLTINSVELYPRPYVYTTEDERWSYYSKPGPVPGDVPAEYNARSADYAQEQGGSIWKWLTFTFGLFFLGAVFLFYLYMRRIGKSFKN
jgi:hypothetical protein